MAVVERGVNYRLHDDGHKEWADGLCYEDNDTGTWEDSDYSHSNDPVIHPGNKPDFAGGLCEEQAWCRKYTRHQKNKEPLMGLAWRGTDGTANKERWINLRTVGADTAVEPVTGNHSVKWTDAWTDADYEVHYYGFGGCEFRITLKSDSAPTTYQWTVKIPGYLGFDMDPANPAHPRLVEDADKIMYFGHPEIFIDGVLDGTFPTPAWSIIPDDPYDKLTLTVDPAKVASAFAAGATTVEVRA